MPAHELHPDGESPAEQALRRFRPPEKARQKAKKKRVTAFLFILNIALITLLYIFVSGRDPGDQYLSSSFNYLNCAFRFSMTRDKETADLIFSLTTRPVEGKAALAFRNGMGEIIVYDGKKVVLARPLGGDVAFLRLGPGEIDVRRAIIERRELEEYGRRNPGAILTPRKSLVQFAKAHMPLTAEVHVHTDRPVSTGLSFNFEVHR